MTIFEYVAEKNPEGAREVMNSFGQKAIRRPDLLAKQLAQAVNQHGKIALFKIAAVHPDLELITSYNEYNAQSNPSEKKEDKPCNCSGESVFSSAEGQAIKKAVEDLSKVQGTNPVAVTKDEKPEKTELMIIGAVAVICLALVLKK